MSGPDPPAPRFPALDPREFAADPITQFQRWWSAAIASGISEPEAAALATSTADGRPSARMVLLKGVDARGFRFFTHAGSRKGRELLANPRVAMVLYWARLDRQVRIEGIAAGISAAESDAYFATRPAGSRLAAAASPQSRVLRDRAELEARVAEWRARHPDGDVPRPPEWGGFRIVPDQVEFWQQGEDRLHDRLRYRREGTGWVLERLAP